MALPAFNAAQHHVGLGATGDQKGFLLDGQLNETFQKLSAPAEFGSERDLLAPIPALSRWTQDDFVGGVFQRIWGSDPAMFASSVGFIPTQLARSLTSMPPLIVQTGLFFSPLENTVLFFEHGGYFYQVESSLSTDPPSSDENSGITRASIADAEEVRIVNSVPDMRIWNAAFNEEASQVWLIHRLRDGSGNFSCRRVDIPGVFTTGTWTSLGDAPVNAQPHGSTFRGRDWVVQWGRNLWVGVPNADAATSIRWTKIGRLPGRWKDSVAFNSLIYILLSDGVGTTQVISFDGTNILPVVELPYNFVGEAITSYAGRLYIGGHGFDVDQTNSHGELYEITGSSLRLLRKFTPELEASTNTSLDRISELQVAEGLLVIGGDYTDGQGLFLYDATTDAFFGGPEITATGLYRHLAVGRDGGLYFLSAADESFGTNIYNRASSVAEFPNGTSYVSEMQTSDFAPEFDRLKRWASMRVRTRYSGTLAAAYSTDGGVTFTSLTVTTGAAVGNYYDHDIDLSALAPSNQIRFRFQLTNTSVVLPGQVLGYTVQFAFIGSEKRAWLMTMLGVGSPEHADRIVRAYDFAAARTQLQAWYAAGTVLDFTDLHGDTYQVVVNDVGSSHPRPADRDANGDREGYYPVALLEV